MEDGSQGGDVPTIIAPIPYIENFVRQIIPECRIPPIWEADDPVAMLREQAADARLAVSFGGFPFDAAMIDALPSLEFVQIVGAGYDGLDMAALARRGIPFANGGDVNCNDVADYAVAMALALRRDLLFADRWIRAGQWRGNERPPVRRSFSSDRAGILGLGAIGKAVAVRLAGFGIPVSWWGPREKPGEALPRASSPLELARQSSILFVCCPLTPETERLVDRGMLDALGPDGLMVTVARGGVTDEDAVIDALREGRLGGAGLDVFWQEPTPPEKWADVPNVILSPHHAGVSVESMANTQLGVAENIRRFFAGEQPRNIVSPSQ